MKIAYFITPHGFGHAARAAAVMHALNQIQPGLHFDIYSTVAGWFFEESHLTNYTIHSIQVDVGLVQRNSLDEDLPATITSLAKFMEFAETAAPDIAAKLKANQTRCVISDISPFGLFCANLAGIPSVMVENFTWDWIYAGYPDYAAALAPAIEVLSGWVSHATHHIQTEPVCQKTINNITTFPVSRPLQQPRGTVRASLGLDENQPLVLVTMGGIPNSYPHMDHMRKMKDLHFILPGASEKPQRLDNLILLPHRHGIYHPDLVQDCDVVIGKLGYSTLAECYLAGTHYGFIPRARFPESTPVAQFALSNMSSTAISEDQYRSGEWLNQLPALLRLPRVQRNEPNGAGQIAEYILKEVLI